MTIAVQIKKKLAIKHSVLTEMVLMIVGSLLIAASAQVRFYLPNTPVPVTMQTLAVLLIGAVLGSWRGMAAIATYVAAGALGLPFFAGLSNGGLALLGPTGGYLLGFVLAGGLMGFLAERQMGGKLLSSIPMFIIGQVVIYVCGTLWLSHFVGGLSQAVFAGVTPFIVGDVIKIALAALALPVAWRFIKAH